MSSKEYVAKSVSDKLRHTARLQAASFGWDLNFSAINIQRRYAYERFLARISETPWRDAWMLKGGVLMLAMQERRATQDMDFSIRLGNPDDIGSVVAAIRDICEAKPLQEDGLEFGFDHGARTAPRALGIETRDNPTVRVHLQAVLKLPRPITVKFMVDATRAEMPHDHVVRTFQPTLRGFDPIVTPCYPWEMVVAEKLHAVMSGTIRNPRIRDYMDILAILRSGHLDLDAAAHNVELVFDARKTDIDLDAVGLTQRFARQRQADWVSILRTTGYADTMPKEFTDAMADVDAFARDVIARISVLSPECL